jgi:uncharacterized protein
MEAVEAKVAALEAILRRHAPLLIAYSGGVDSAYLLSAAHRVLGERAAGVLADSPSLPRRALQEALAVAEGIGARVEVIRTAELADPNYASNPLNRCYFCKAELFQRLDQMAHERSFAAIAYGENADDARQVRPGVKAAVEFAVVAPLKEAGLTKAEIRQLSREAGLPTADAPAQPCLSSRIPHGTPVSVEALGMIERGEALVRSLGFRVFRVRHHAGAGMDVPRAKVQIAPEEMGALGQCAETMRAGLLDVGYGEVEFDPQGYRASGT